MAEFTVKFMGIGTAPLRAERLSAPNAHEARQVAAQRIGSSRTFARALVYEGADLRFEIDKTGYSRAAV
ncbi:hypothetical protein GGQ87_000110 [Brevundimonas alba]|uniref:Uncharacterized protein n=1 Tax=Brevundimonas alba TaxID=74314 RepID=A0A7X5YH63_9CAUL|nr:hypothetical protein [Brevundimonas alba]NJC39852.1 hypothetical protein [Brevundimonas alba]